MKAYLAGAIEYAPDRGKAWRDDISQFLKEKLGHDFYNPLIEESKYLTPEELATFRKYKEKDFKYFQSLVRKLIDGDLATLLSEIDYIICFWDEYAKKGGGTYGELTMAYWKGLPVYMVTNIPIQEISSWILGCVTEVFTNWDELKQFLLKKYLNSSP